MPDYHSLNPLLAIALIFAAGYPAGLLARRLRIPAITGNIVAGVVLGPSVLGVFSRSTAHDLGLVTLFAMALVTVLVGGHLSYRRLQSATRRILSVTLCEAFLTSTLVGLTALLVVGQWQTAILLGAIAASTAPATVLAVVKEERAKGLMVKTLLATVALDNVICIVLFSFALALVAHTSGASEYSFLVAVSEPAVQLLLAAALGAVAGGLLLITVRDRIIPPFSGLLLAILLTTGGAQYLGLLPLVSGLALGVVLGNFGGGDEGLISSLEDLEPVLLTCFFTLAGVDLELGQLGAVGVLGGAYFLARTSGKIVGGVGGAYLGACLPRFRNYIGPALLPQAGLAIGLVVILQGDTRLPEELVATITNVVLAIVVINEILGPPLVKRAVVRSGEAHKDRRRIVEFLQEEHLLTPLQSGGRKEAIRELAEFLIQSHGLSDITVDELIRSVEEREASISTAIGAGIAIPHALVAAGPEIMGVMGITNTGIDFGADDGEPCHFIVLIATPEEHKERHTEVLAAVARIMSDPTVRARLLFARDPAEAFEAIDTDLRQDYNYFLED